MNLQDALGGAIAYERRIRDWYAQCAESIADPRGRKVFAILSREEQGHVSYLESRLEEWNRDGQVAEAELPSVLPAPEWIRQAAASLGEPKGPVGPVPPAEIEYLKQALEMERSTSGFYQHLVQQLEPAHRPLFSRFLEIEDGHLTLVQAEIDALAGHGHWFDVMEFRLEQ